MEDDYTGGDICIDCSTDCIGNDIVYGSRTDIHLRLSPTPLYLERGYFLDLNSQKARAAAAATLRESTWWCMGMRTT